MNWRPEEKVVASNPTERIRRLSALQTDCSSSMMAMRPCDPLFAARLESSRGMMALGSSGNTIPWL
jgi:hypothetical protein